MKYPPSVSIIILNWNSTSDTLRCLESINTLDYQNFNCLVVDNNSNDHSIERIINKYSKASFVETGQNLGYSGGNNVGIRWALNQGADWVFILNSDTILAPDALTQMLQWGQLDETIGILGPMVYHAALGKVIQSAGGTLDRYWRAYHRGQNQLDEGQYSQPELVDWISGCALLVRSKMITNIGLLDERFFAYQEELDYCIRARKSGWNVVYVPGAQIWHSGVTPDYQPKPYVTYYMTRNRLLLLLKNRVELKIWFASFFEIIRTLLSWSIRPKWRGKRNHRDEMWYGVEDFMRSKYGMRSR